MGDLPEYTDEYVAKLLKSDAEASSIKYSTLGIEAFLPQRPRGEAPKPNTRFLKNLLRETDTHNAALLAKEQREAKARQKELKRKEERGDRHENRKDDGRHRKRRRVNESDEPSNRADEQRRQSREERRSSRSSKDHVTYDDGYERKRRHRKRRSRSRDSEDDEVPRSKRRERKRSRSRDRRSHKESKSHTSHAHRDRHRETRRRSRSRSHSPQPHRYSHRNSRKRSRSPKRSRSSSTESQRHASPRQTARRSDNPRPHSHATPASDSDPLEAVVGPLPPPPPPKVKQRGRGVFTSSSAAIDSHFSSAYDPTADVLPDPDTDDDWDMALEALRDRQKWKQQGADRLRAAGFSEEEVKKWEKGGEKDADDVKWKGKGEGREWDRGKVVSDEGVELQPEWGRLKGT